MIEDFNILLGGPQRLTLEGLRSIVTQRNGTVLGITTQVDHLLRMARQPDICLTLVDGGEGDWSAPVFGKRFHGNSPGAPFLYVASERRVNEALQTIPSYGGTVVPRSASSDDLDGVIRRVIARRRSEFPHAAPSPQDEIMTETSLADTLTPRQADILSLLYDGESVKSIAHKLHISPRTVEFHKYRLMKALQVSSQAALIRYAFETGITRRDPPRRIARQPESPHFRTFAAGSGA